MFPCTQVGTYKSPDEYWTTFFCKCVEIMCFIITVRESKADKRQGKTKKSGTGKIEWEYLVAKIRIRMNDLHFLDIK